MSGRWQADLRQEGDPQMDADQGGPYKELGPSEGFWETGVFGCMYGYRGVCTCVCAHVCSLACKDMLVCVCSLMCA